MQSRRARFLTLVAALGLSALLCSCGDDGPSEVPDDGDCLGPAGGTISITDTTDALAGVSFHVPAGAWDDCWSVAMLYHSTFSTPNFPDGLEGYEGWLTGGIELEIGRADGGEWTSAPDSLDFELTLPLRGLSAQLGEKIVAYRYDEAAGLYRLVLPVRQDEHSITVRGHHTRQLWTWGKIDIGEIDFETYLTPVMEELHGAGGWLEIRAELVRLQADAVAQQNAITCAALQIVRAAFVGAREAAADNVRAIQDGLHRRCGTCDALTSVFYEDLGEYVKLQVGSYLVDLFFGESRSLLLKLYSVIMCTYLEYCADQLPCDYECFAESVGLDFYINLAMYYASEVVVELIDWAIISGYVDCPGQQAVVSSDHGPLPAGWTPYLTNSSFLPSTPPALSRRAR